ncbi:MAG: MMPL family transporter [Acidimicrobiales bacterium]|nr:MMPL family transporter [Acidimicrobiales bacterium]MCB1014826.1 MMPL family transporter [Acidimicrobiales bacterium]MCB9371549.1 MMPL family transporter [Microthrixaceae bacterium]
MFARIGPFCHDRRRWVLGAWIVALLAVNILAGSVGNDFRDEFNLPDVESKRGFDILDDAFGGQGTGIVGTIVFEADQGVDDPAVQSAMEELLAEVAAYDDVVRVESPYDEQGALLVSSQGPRAGEIAYANVELPDDVEWERGQEIRDQILEDAPEVDGLNIELGGFIFAEFQEPESEVIGLAFAIVILILAFGSVLAMGLPVGVALFGIGIGQALITLLSNVVVIPDFATFLGIMIGLGVGIDYALLVVTRYREQLHAGHTVRESVGISLDTAGRSVVFAGATVVISLLGMLLMGVSFVQGLAIGAAAVVAVTVLASMTLLPALLGFAGERVEVTRWRGLIAAGLVAVSLAGVGLGLTPLMLGLPVAVLVLLVSFLARWIPFLRPLKAEVPRRPVKPRHQTVAYRWSRVVQHHPWISAIGATALLLVLALPVLGLRLGFSDESNFPEDTSTRQAYDLLVEGFGAGFNGPLLLVAELPAGTDLSSLEAVQAAVADDPGVVFASPAQPNDPDDPAAVVWQVIPTTGPQAEETTQLVNRLRDDVLPPIEDDAGVEINVSGNVAVNLDFSDFLTSRLPWFFGAVLLLSFLLLMVVFRSLLVPLKAVVMNLLSIAAAYGIVVALFQWGWLSDLTGVAPAPIEPWMPMMMFAIVFGLSMDYEVFLLSRVREEWHRTGDARGSVADGLAATAKVITAAAAIMVFVFGSFILEQDRTVKLMGVGLASAILLDATIVRMLLVPATMELLGDRNWWLPRWLDRILPNIDVEGHIEDASADDLPADGPAPTDEPELVGAGEPTT